MEENQSSPIQQVHPLVIHNKEGEIVDVSLMNNKAYIKSREREVLWHLHRETGRVLPYDENLEMSELKSGKNWYEAVLDKRLDPRQTPPPETSHAPEQAAFDREKHNPTRQPPFDSDPAPGAEADSAAGCGRTIEMLERTIRRRKATLPEGSYTSHLFTSGADKIRKKAGEEAVELLLAEGNERIVSEAADLLYHMLVLLAFYDIPVSSVCGELARRHEGDT